MTTDIACPQCGEAEDLVGERSGDSIIIVCQACAMSWDRDLRPQCPTCGETDVRPAFEAFIEKSRGTQLSMQSAKLIHLCPTCDAARLRDYNKTSSPIMPAELPTIDEHDR